MKLDIRQSPQPAQDLPDHDDVVETCEMGACVSVVVLWDKQGGSYQNVRGYHGGGGLEAVNFDSLLKGVPSAPSTQVFIIAGTDNKSDYGRKFINGLVKQEILGRLPHVAVRIYHMVSNAKVDRTGKVNILVYEQP